MTAALFTNRGRSGVFAILGLVGLLGAASVFVQMTRDRWYHTDKPAEQILYVRSPETVRRMALSYDALAADVYWIRAVQDFGGARLGATRYELLYPLLDMATALDPRFNIAYRFGSLFLAEPAPGGPGRPDQAIALLRKGIKEMPWKWQYYQDAGFVYYFRYKDYPTAADWFKRASEIEGAPYFLKPLAANTLAKGQNREASRMLYRAIAETADNDFMRNDAFRRLRQLDSMDDIDVLRMMVRRYRERTPAAQRLTWQTLIAARVLRFVPRDRDGFDYVLDPTTGDVRLSADSPLGPLPTETPEPGESSVLDAIHAASLRPVAISDRLAAAARAEDASVFIRLMTTPIPPVLIFLIYGLMIGSFLNVCIYRIPLGKSVVHPGSHCTKCGTAIRWYQNIPILSWIVLRAKCGSCGDPISIIYPLIEAATGALFAAHYLWFGLDWILLPRLLFACALLVLAFIDLEHRILPNPITLGGTVIGFAFSFAFPPGWQASLIGILLGGGVLFVVGELYLRVRGIEGMGMGDVKMLGMIGAFLGWKAVIVTIMLASISGAIVGAILMLAQKGDKQYPLPFGTFLSAAALVASFFGDAWMDWYVNQLG